VAGGAPVDIRDVPNNDEFEWLLKRNLEYRILSVDLANRTVDLLLLGDKP
jgi:hypothetical protein